MVYVISKDNKALMPCSNVISRLLLKEGKAKVKKKCPFTIKLTYDTTNYVQDLYLGLDTGSAYVGSAVVNENNEVFYMSQIEIRNDITEKMKQRSKYRRSRRNRKTRYRKARWLNRRKGGFQIFKIFDMTPNQNINGVFGIIHKDQKIKNL